MNGFNCSIIILNQIRLQVWQFPANEDRKRFYRLDRDAARGVFGHQAACHIIVTHHRTNPSPIMTGVPIYLKVANSQQCSSACGISDLLNALSNSAMRIAEAFVAGWLLPTALANAIPGAQDTSSTLAFNERQDGSTQSYGGKKLQADAYARIARLGQQTYQATHHPSQWKKCNVSNIIIRREW
jgi:hypothetical protein